MTTIVVPRCLKMPGLMARARTYRLEWNEKGLYLICLGNATLNVQGGHTAARAIASGVVNKMAGKFEKQAQETEARIEREGLDIVARTKKSYFVTATGINTFEYKPLANGSLRLKIKGPGVHLSLLIHPYYQTHLDSVRQQLGI